MKHPVVSQTPAERVEHLKHRVHLAALKAELGNLDPWLHIEDIERNRGRQGKAITDLKKAGHLRYHGKHPRGSWDREENAYWVTGTFDECVKEYAAQHEGQGEDTVREHMSLFLGTTTDHWNPITLLNAGWTTISKASLTQLAHAWVHRDEYLYQETTKSDKPDGKPRAWDMCPHPVYMIHRQVHEVLPKMLLRNAVEIYAGKMYDYLTLKEAGVKGWTDDATLDVTVPNVGYVNPTNMNLTTIRNHVRVGIEILKKYNEVCEKVETAIERNGGEKAWGKAVLTMAIQEMISSAPPIMAAGDDTHLSGKRLQNMDGLSRYVLMHGGLMSYEKLFDDRPGVMSMAKEYAWAISRDVEPVDVTGKDLLSGGFKTLLFGKEEDM